MILLTCTVHWLGGHIMNLDNLDFRYSGSVCSVTTSRVYEHISYNISSCLHILNKKYASLSVLESHQGSTHMAEYTQETEHTNAHGGIIEVAL
jgi:hypothetical protein